MYYGVPRKSLDLVTLTFNLEPDIYFTEFEFCWLKLMAQLTGFVFPCDAPFNCVLKCITFCDVFRYLCTAVL